MTHARVSTVEIEVHDRPTETEAKALLDLGGDIRGGWGRARRDPADPDRPSVGEELAVARALSYLARLPVGVAVRAAVLLGQPVDMGVPALVGDLGDAAHHPHVAVGIVRIDDGQGYRRAPPHVAVLHPALC